MTYSQRKARARLGPRRCVPHHLGRAKAFFAFALLIAYSAGHGRVVNDGEAVHFIVDKAVGLCYLLPGACYCFRADLRSASRAGRLRLPGHLREISLAPALFPGSLSPLSGDCEVLFSVTLSARRARRRRAHAARAHPFERQKDAKPPGSSPDPRKGFSLCGYIAPVGAAHFLTPVQNGANREFSANVGRGIKKTVAFGTSCGIHARPSARIRAQGDVKEITPPSPE